MRAGSLAALLALGLAAVATSALPAPRATTIAQARAPADAQISAVPQTAAPALAVLDEQLVSRILQQSPLPAQPSDPTNAHADDPAAAQLGHFLFFDTRLSQNGALSCASCHQPERAFTDGRALSHGIADGTRNTPSLWNAAWQRWLFWDGRADSLWSQALKPIEHASELGGNRTRIAHLVCEDPPLRAAFEAVFGALPSAAEMARIARDAKPIPEAEDDPLARAWSALSAADQERVNRIFANVGKALEAFERHLASRNSAFDRFAAALRTQDVAAQAAYPEAARRGLAIFMGKANCRLCHAGPNFTDDEFHNIGIPPRAPERSETQQRSESPQRSESSARSESTARSDRSPPNEPLMKIEAGRHAAIELVRKDPFSATGAFSDAPDGARARELAALVRSADDFGRFKTPSLRNVALTAPYMHQGQLASLHEVLEYYSTLKGAVPAGHHGEQVIKPLELSAAEIDDVIAFLETLNDVSSVPRLLLPPAAPRPTSAPEK